MKLLLGFIFVLKEFVEKMERLKLDVMVRGASGEKTDSSELFSCDSRKVASSVSVKDRDTEGSVFADFKDI